MSDIESVRVGQYACAWQGKKLMTPSFTTIATVEMRKGVYEALLRVGDAQLVNLYTYDFAQAKKRTEQLYRMVVETIDDAAKAAETGFMLRSELSTTDSEDT